MFFIRAEWILRSLLRVFSLTPLLSFDITISIYYALKEKGMQIHDRNCGQYSGEATQSHIKAKMMSCKQGIKKPKSKPI